MGIGTPLLGQQHALHGPEQQKRNDDQQRNGDQHMHPPDGRIGDLNAQNGTNAKDAGKQHDKPGRTVAQIGEGKVEPANRATLRDLQVAGKESPPPTARTFAAHAGLERREIGIVVFRHA